MRVEIAENVVKKIVYETIRFMATKTLRGSAVINGRAVRDCVDIKLITEEQANKIIEEIRNNANEKAS